MAAKGSANRLFYPIYEIDRSNRFFIAIVFVIVLFCFDRVHPYSSMIRMLYTTYVHFSPGVHSHGSGELNDEIRQVSYIVHPHSNVRIFLPHMDSDSNPAMYQGVSILESVCA